MAPAPPSHAVGGQLFTREAVAFLVELRSNNDRDWFKANQERYEAVVREPARAFIRQMAPLLQKLSPHFVANDKKVGGSMMRPQRDTRFSSNKEPYKTNVGIHFRHAAGKDVHAPGLYFHFDPDEAFIGAGIWRPEAEVLLKLRRRIADAPKEWTKAVGGKTFRDTFNFGGDTLKRPPRGFNPDHPLIETLKRKDFIAVQDVDHASLLSPKLTHELYRRFRAAMPFTKFLAESIGLPL